MEALTFKLDTVAVVVVVAAAVYGDNKAPQAGIWVLGSGLARLGGGKNLLSKIRLK